MDTPAPRYRLVLTRVGLLALMLLVSWGLLWMLSNHTSFLYSIRGMRGSVPPIGTLLDPDHGLWFTARTAQPRAGQIGIPDLKEPVTIVRDERGVPHIYAESDRGAVIAMGYVLAQDRLFQLDFIPRAAAGRLAEVFGPSLLDTDRYLRSTGMEWAAQANLDSIALENTVEKDLLDWFSLGVNSYISRLEAHELPVEFRLLGYEPDVYEPIHAIRVLQYMSYDLSFATDRASYGRLKDLMNADEYARLYPSENHVYVPIVDRPKSVPQKTAPTVPDTVSSDVSGLVDTEGLIPENALFPGYRHGKGSNNWAVTGDRSENGGAILAGDMHLDLTLPAIWYEVHLVTPELDTRGVLIPGAPLPVEAFNGHFGWAFTNTGADQIDHYGLVVDSTRTAYRFNEKWVEFDLLVDSIEVRGVGFVPDTVRLTRFGPVMGWPDNPVAIQWTAHKRARTLQALWHMHHAETADDFQEALRKWDSPMQNILYADVDGNIMIRSTGHLPIRRSGHGEGLLEGTRDSGDWIGRVPFDDLPFSANPPSGYLASANQRPAGDWYPYYLGHDWDRGFRSVRINHLLESEERHGVDEMKAYQSDVHVVQRDLFVPMMDSLSGLSEDGLLIRRLLLDWDGRASLDQSASLVLDEYLDILEDLTWDEFDAERLRRPQLDQLYRLLTEDPESRWLDIRSTDLMRETAPELVRAAIEATADTMRLRYGWDVDAWRWSRHHKLLIRHLTKSDALSAFSVGPVPFPGFANTLSPAPDRVTTNSASWRMVVDFSTSPPEAFGVYPGGQSGNPYSTHYADFVEMFTHFGYYRLTRPEIGELESVWILKLEPLDPPSENQALDE